MSCNLRSPSVVDDVVGGLEWSRATCTFFTFGKAPTLPRSGVVRPSTTGNTRVQPPVTIMSSVTNSDVCGTGNGRERKSSTETGPPDPAALRPCSSESTSTARCPTPDDDDDVFPVADVGCSSVSFSRSTSVPPRRTRSCAQPPVVSEVPASHPATSIKISPPRMKRRKKKSAPESESESRKASSLTTSGRNNLVLPFVARCSNKVTDVATQSTTNETKSNDANDDSNMGDGDSLPIEQPVSEVSFSRENRPESREAETKRKKNIRWKTDVAQSSPDVASDDADSKESGYITLEDLQAQLGLSSWSSDERQTDQDVFSSSGDELRAPEVEVLRGAQSTLSTSSTFGAPSAAMLIPPPSSSSFLSPLMPPEPFDALGGGIDCCRSAPPTCDASLLKFTFTVRLDSKMFHRRATNKGGRRNAPLMMVTDVQERGWCGTTTDRCKEPPEPDSSRAETGGTDDQTRAMVENASSKTTEAHSSSSPTSGSSPARQNMQSSSVSTTASTSPPDCAPSLSNSVQQFAGEKVVVTAEVHRSADQLDSEPSRTSSTQSAMSNYQRLKTKSSAVRTDTSAQKESARRTVVHHRALSTSCQPDDIITCCSPEAELVDRQSSMSRSLHHDRSDSGLNGRLNYVDVDKVVSKRQTFDRQQSSTSAVSQRSNKVANGLTLTLRKPQKPRHSNQSASDVKTLPHKMTNEPTAGRNQRKTDGGSGTSSKVRSTVDSAGRRMNRQLSCERTLGRMFSESSSVSSDSEPDICGPCITKESMATMACSRGCPANCSRHAGKAGTMKLVDRSLSTATTESSTAKRSKSTRRALRQFFRVENLFACRHGRPSSDKYPSCDNERQGIGCGEETSSKTEILEDSGRRGVLVGGSESATCRGRCGRSTTQSTLQPEPPGSRTCRRSRQSRSSRRTDGDGIGSATTTASRSVSPHARSRRTSRAADERRMPAPPGTFRRAVSRHRSTDRSSTVGRCRHVWNRVADDKENSCTPAVAVNDWNARGGGQRWNTLCISPSNNSILTAESAGCGFSSNRRVLATTPISPTTPAPDTLHTATLGNVLSYCFVPFVRLSSSCSFSFYSMFMTRFSVSLVHHVATILVSYQLFLCTLM